MQHLNGGLANLGPEFTDHKLLLGEGSSIIDCDMYVGAMYSIANIYKCSLRPMHPELAGQTNQLMSSQYDMSTDQQRERIRSYHSRATYVR